jgi:hypothetical protein
MDFATNPYAAVLIPEPMDYFAACGATSMCEAKCRAEYESFAKQLVVEEAMHSMSPTTKSVERTTESMLFVDLDDDAYTPMNIMAMVELSDCRWVIGVVTCATCKTCHMQNRFLHVYWQLSLI